MNISSSKHSFYVYFVLLLISFLATASAENVKKISTMNILLPICAHTTCKPVFAKVTGEGGCFDWYPENPNLLSIHKIRKPTDNSDCYSKVLISPLTTNVNEITYLIARDKDSNEEFKVKVGFAELYKLSIEKNFDLMNVGELFELHVQAHDKRGNLFTSLEGWSFNWKITVGADKAELIKLSSFGNKKIGPKRTEIEKKTHSDIIAVRGHSVGKITIGVDILEPGLKDTQTQERDLYFVEPFKIVPRDLYILPNTQFNFDIQLQNTKKMLSTNDRIYFEWSVDKPDCGKVQGFGEFESWNEECIVEVTAKDTRLEVAYKDSVIVHVVYPNNLNIGYREISEEEKANYKSLNFEYNDLTFSPVWGLVEGKNYFFKNFLMFDNVHPVYFNNGKTKFSLNFENLAEFIDNRAPKCFGEQEKCTMRTIKDTNHNRENVESVAYLNGGHELRSQKTVIIYKKVQIEKFNMPYFTLPFIPSNPQELYLKVNGGTGIYKYSTSDQSTVGIKQNRVISANKLGKAIVRVEDSEIPQNFDEIEIQVKDVTFLTYFEERQEIAKGDSFQVTPVGIHDLEGGADYTVNKIFTNCTNLSFKSEINLKNKIETSQSEKLSTKTPYQKIQKFIRNNKEAVVSKMHLNMIKSDYQKGYLEYASFGICGINNYTAVEEGLVQVTYVADQNSKIISARNPAQIYIYLPLQFNPTIKDSFTETVIQRGNITHPDAEKTFILKDGVGLVLSMVGGVIPWVNHKEDYLEDKYLIDSAQNTKALETIKKKIQVRDLESKKIFVNCLNKDIEEKIQINIHNKADKTLLKPANNKITFTIGCYKPKALGIYFLSQKENTILPMYSIFQRAGIDYYEKVNTTDILRVYAFDERKRMFSNITMLHGIWTALSVNDDKEKFDKYYEILNDKQIAKYGINDISYSHEFLQNVVLFKHTSKFYFKYSMKSDIISHYATINIIDRPTIVPENATLYIRDTEPFELEIKGGSGKFEVSLSDSSLSSYTYDSYEKKIKILPTQKGILRVFVKDLYLPNEEKASSILYLSDVDKINLIGDGPLLVNNTLSINIEVYDNFGHKYPERILSKIRMSHTSNDETGVDLSFSEDQKKLNVRGLIAGLYTVYVKDYGSQVKSNDAKVEVFDRLEIFPPYLLLVPGSSYTLSVSGGPKDDKAILRYEMVDSKIANVSSISYPEVNALLQGETKLKVSLLYNFDYNKFYNKEDDKPIINRTEILCVEEVPVRVDFPNKIEIMGAGNNRNVFTGSTIRLLTAIKKDEEVFTYGIGPFEFKWEVDNNRIAKIKYYSKSAKSDVFDTPNMVCYTDKSDLCSSLTISEEDPTPMNSIGVFLNTLQEGIISISLTVKISYPYPYTRHTPNIFKTSEKVKIGDEVVANINSKYGTPQKQTGLYMIPFDVDHELKTNKNTLQTFKIKHKESDSNILSLTETGRVTTYKTVGQVTIEISQAETKDGTPSLPTLLVVYVSDFYAIFIEKSFNLIDMQIGQEMYLKVRIQHDTGIAFADKCERIPLRLVESHPKIAKGELIESNSQIRIKAHNIGSTNIILFHPKTRKIYDVFKINVNKDVTFLQKIVLNLGGTINFLGKDKERKAMLSKDAEWVSENPSVISIDPYKGEATALSEGTSTIYLRSNDKTKIILTTMVEVSKVKNIVMDKSTIPTSLTDIKSNPNYQSEYHVPVNLLTEKDEKFTTNQKDSYSEINQNILFKCSTDNADLFIVQHAKKDDDNECVIKIRDNKYNTKAAKPKNVAIRLIAESTPSNTKTKYTFESKENIPFSSSFNIKDSVKEVSLTFSKREKYIYIDNLNDLEFKISDENKLKIEEENKDQGYIKIVVPTGISDSYKNVDLTITNILSRQTETIKVSFTAASGSTLFFGLVSQEAFTDFLTMLLLIVIIIILIFYITNSGKPENVSQPMMNPPMYGPRGNMYGSATPSNVRNGPKGSSHQAALNMNTNYGFN